MAELVLCYMKFSMFGKENYCSRVLGKSLSEQLLCLITCKVDIILHLQISEIGMHPMVDGILPLPGLPFGFCHLGHSPTPGGMELG